MRWFISIIILLFVSCTDLSEFNLQKEKSSTNDIVIPLCTGTIFQDFNAHDSSTITNAGSIVWQAKWLAPSTWYAIPEGYAAYMNNQTLVKGTNSYIYANGRTNVNMMTNQNGSTNNCLVIHIFNDFPGIKPICFVLWDGINYSCISPTNMIDSNIVVKFVWWFSDITGVNLASLRTVSTIYITNEVLIFDYIYATNE
jgi:hypothetical protein